MLKMRSNATACCLAGSIAVSFLNLLAVLYGTLCLFVSQVVYVIV